MSYEASRKVGGAEDTSYRGATAAPGYEFANGQEMRRLSRSDGERWREMPPMQRTRSERGDDEQGLLSHAQSVPQSSGPWPPDASRL